MTWFHKYQNKIYATGTIQEFNTAHCLLKSEKVLSKYNKGIFDYFYNELVYICRWNNLVISVTSKCYTHEPLGLVKRYSSAKNWCPSIWHCSKAWGVDVTDKTLRNFRPQLWSKKWWSLFSNTVNMAAVTS